mmetsp:Transcript_88581/g.251084  ORF Transcript_88581/g.251084 Transcript_88581/m.251084 type:complete len:232 (-) Transcript_88581:12-707(-)
MTAIGVPSNWRSSFWPGAMPASSVSITMGRPRMVPDSSFIVSTTVLYSPSLRKPVSGESPPLISSSRSHDWRSVMSTVLSALLITSSLLASSTMRLTSLPPCGVCFAIMLTSARRAGGFHTGKRAWGLANPAWAREGAIRRFGATNLDPACPALRPVSEWKKPITPRAKPSAAATEAGTSSFLRRVGSRSATTSRAALSTANDDTMASTRLPRQSPGPTAPARLCRWGMWA